ncbi:MAG: LCP family protein [Anaerolineales bacterium]|nr:LCP family protein [Anaerolineales bacterium]MCX7755273.1 LCP family protein [Anaerolineales bacterium]
MKKPLVRTVWHALVAIFLLTSCGEIQTAPSPVLPYYFVTAPANATPTPTPFQPFIPAIGGQPLAALPPTLPLQLSATLPPQVVTATPLPTAIPATPPAPLLNTPPTLLDAPDVITFLLLGSDLRPGSSYRTDTLVIAIVRPHEGQVSLVSIPRDLWVNIPTVGMNRINTAYQSGELTRYPGGGPGLLRDTLRENLGLTIDHTAMVDFDGFRRIVDTLGGIDVPVACSYTDWRLIDPSLDPYDENNWTLFTTGQGLIHMDGDYALWYARSRSKSNDFDRGRRQQEVLRALYGQALRADVFSRLPQLYADFRTTIRTDVGLDDVLQLAPLALHLSNADIRSYYIAGELVTPWTTPGGAYVLLPNTALIQEMLRQAISPSPRQQQRQTWQVEIRNGTPYDNWEMLAAERLNYAGYETTFRASDHRNYAQTLLYDLTPDQDRTRSASLLAVLGLSESALVAVPSPGAQTAYVVILGMDYDPCFRPQELAP